MTLRILSYQKLLLSLLVSNFLLGDADTTDIDLDALWESTVWEEIEEINEIEGEVELRKANNQKHFLFLLFRRVTRSLLARAQRNR